jgi:Flp pilus assembly protein TadG
MLQSARGQALVEFALIAPVVALLLFGGLYVTLLVSDDIKAGYAVRAGVRLASELGGRQSNPTAPTAQIDGKVVNNVLAVMQPTTYATVDQVDIYAVSSSDGTMQPSDPVDTFDGSGHPLATQSFPLELRIQSPPDETSVGIRVRWHYTTPLFGFGSVSMSTYAVMRMTPITS